MTQNYYLTLPREAPPADVLAALRVVRAWQVEVRAREQEELRRACETLKRFGQPRAQDWRDELLGIGGRTQHQTAPGAQHQTAPGAQHQTAPGA